jgi:predicted dinucleotide-binding enzyme
MARKVGIIGGGNVGQTLCKQLLNKGRPVVCGSRNPTALQQQFASQGLAAEVLSVKDAVSQAEIVILAIPGECCAVGLMVYAAMCHAQPA